MNSAVKNRILSLADAASETSYFAWVMRFFSYYFFYYNIAFSPVKEA